MDSDSSADDGIDIADHVVATSEPETPGETVARLFGDHDPQESEAARETIAKLFDADDRLEAVDEASASDEGVCRGAATTRPDEPTRHEIHVGDSVEYAHCLDGALITAELVGHEPATVRSFDPVSGEPVTFRIADDGRTVTPADAVASMGMAAAAVDSEDMIGFGVGMAVGERDAGAYVEDPLDVFCRNFNAFERVESYRQWADDADAVSVAVPAAVFAELIHGLVDSPAFG